jgi:RNA polymerase sigma-70 factor (ECF subfamily)
MTEAGSGSGAVRNDEQRWIAQARQGDDDAYSAVVNAFQGPVYNLCFRMLGNRQEAEDAAQETFLKAYRSLERYDPGRPFVNWILRIASNHCVDRMRRGRLRPMSLEALHPGLQSGGPSPGPESTMVGAEKEAQVREMLRDLGSTDRAAVILFYWHDMSYEEIGETLSLTVSAVKSRLHRARKELAMRWLSDEAAQSPVREAQDEPSTL